MPSKPSLDELAGAPLPEDATVWDKRMKALTLRNAGATYARIGIELGVTEIRAREYVKVATREIVAIPVDQMVERQRAILLDITRVNYSPALKGDKEAQGVILRALEHEAKLYGLYAPTRVNVGVSETEFARQAAELLAVIGPEPLKELAGVMHQQVAAASPAEAAVDEAITDAEVISVEEDDPDIEDDDGADWSNL
jgi:predicted transcriptional regulator